MNPLDRPSRLGAGVRLLAFGALCAGCSFRTTDPFVSAVGNSAGVLHLASSTPADNAIDVPTGAAVVLAFNDFPDPDSLGSLVLENGGVTVATDASVDLIANTVTVLPKAPLAQSQSYVLSVTGMKSLGGAMLDAPTMIHFTTGAVTGGGPTPPPARTLTGDVAPLLGQCANLGCHDAATRSEDLDLSTPTSAAMALIGVASAERPMLSRVKASDPSRSYLLRKLLGTPDISGARMPSGGDRLADSDLRVFSDWIASGAAVGGGSSSDGSTTIDGSTIVDGGDGG